jgi:hypothetical protein
MLLCFLDQLEESIDSISYLPTLAHLRLVGTMIVCVHSAETTSTNQSIGKFTWREINVRIQRVQRVNCHVKAKNEFGLRKKPPSYAMISWRNSRR